MQTPPKPGLDPLAIVVLAVAALLAAGLVLWLFLSIRSAPSPEPAKGAAEDVREGIAGAAKKLIERFGERTKPAPTPPAPRATRAPAPSAKPAATRPAPPGQRPTGIDLPAGKTWTYSVRLEPEVWKDAVLVYRSVAEQGGVAVQTDFRHAQGNLTFRLGTYAAGHRSHAQMRFPGFFMHGAYFDFPLTPGKRFSWEYPWQMRDNSIRAGRVRHFEATVGATEPVSVPAGRYDAVRLDVTLNYIDGGKTLATVNEALWYAPSIRQIVKVVRSGRSPDEAGQRIVADLAEIR